MSLKAFELVPAIEREQLIGDKSSNTSIECIECCGPNFFIGTTDGSIIKYGIKEEARSSGKTIVKASKVIFSGTFTNPMTCFLYSYPYMILNLHLIFLRPLVYRFSASILACPQVPPPKEVHHGHPLRVGDRPPPGAHRQLSLRVGFFHVRNSFDASCFRW